MPFTPSHVIAAAPIWWASGRRLNLAGLVAGTLGPDLLQHAGVLHLRAFSHSWVGLLLLDLPVAVVLLALWVHVVREPMALLMPRRWAVSLGPATQLGRPRPQAVVNLVVSILLGGATHLVWDAFTHPGAWGVERCPVLDRSLTWLGVTLPGYRWLHYASSAAGLLGLLVWLAIGWRRAPRRIDGPWLPIRWHMGVWIMLVFAATAGAAWMMRLAPAPTDTSAHLHFLVAFTWLGAAMGAGVVLLAYCLAAKIWLVRQSRLASPSFPA